MDEYSRLPHFPCCSFFLQEQHGYLGAIGPELMSGACEFANKMVQKLSKTFFLGGGGFRVFLLICLMIYNVQGHTDTKFVFGCKSEC